MNVRVPVQARIARVVVLAAFAHAVRNGVTAMNPMRELVPVERSKPAPRALTDDEDIRLRQLARDWRTLRDDEGDLAPGPRPTSDRADMVDLPLGTGMRIGGALALRWENTDIAADPPTLTVAGTLVDSTGGLRRPAHPKTDAGFRRLTPPDGVAAVLVRRQAEAVSGKLFATRNSTWVAPDNLRRSLRSALAGPDLTRVTNTAPPDRRDTDRAGARGRYRCTAARPLAHGRDARHYVEQAHDAGDIRSVLRRSRQTAV